MAFKQEMGKDFNPTMPLAKVMIAEYGNSTKYIRCLLNPTSIEFAINVGIGKPQPVGWSNPIKQYSHTGEVVSGLELILNEYVLTRYKAGGWSYAKNKVTSIMDYVNWLTSYCYTKDAGYSPKPLVLHWPNVCNLVFVIESCRTRFTRFNRSLSPVEGAVSLGISELRTSFIGSDSQYLSGFLGREETTKTSGGTGTPLNSGNGDHD